MSTVSPSTSERSVDVGAVLKRFRESPGLQFWFDVLVAAGCLGGLIVSILSNVQVRAADQGAVDFKTLYASMWCFAHRMSAYNFTNIQRVYTANGVMQPASWFGRAPVYPWTTLALLSPLSAMGMVSAAYGFTIFSCALMAIALAALMRYAASNFGLGPIWRLALAVLFAAEPLVGFGLDVGNVSVAASALCIVAFVWRDSDSRKMHRGLPWVPAAALATALALKPHIAFWVWLGMLLLPEKAGRKVAVRAGAVFASFAAATAAAMAATGTLAMQMHGQLAMLSAEAATGAANSATSHTVLPVAAEITSLNSVLGFWISSPLARLVLTGIAVLGVSWVLVRLTRRVDSERVALAAVGAWCALGLLATYHRAEDAMLLMLLLPWVLDRIRRTPWVWYSWALVACYFVICTSWDASIVRIWVESLPWHSPLVFLLLRQAGLANCLFLIVLLAAIHRDIASPHPPPSHLAGCGVFLAA